ncbi:hypothetical protein Poli38472_009716 [Pythium oligandrum]|uniref:WD40 repeat-like protein n=1 Tax=Pythium oligandrum TaxID=41045 RepID=A0A8K1CFS9_PYTOL|nr:hypothetical protein Poli38472_009716 [Pythium oligandrum]|eukprot:TMW62223.1 hypothetical protein Poli38472_009716 [Pythium oligandrum]
MATTPVLTFRGHRGAVNALLSDEDKQPHVLVSGSEDGSCRLWDVRTTRATKCINVKKALGLSPQDDPDDASVNSMAFGTAKNDSSPHYLYLAAGSKILTFDLRHEGLILDVAAQELFQDSDEELNHLAVHPGKQGKYLSAPDDNGDIRIYDLEAHRLFKTLRGQHSNICMCAPFRPNAPWDLVSGGMDGLLLFWDFSRGRLKFQIDLNASGQSLEDVNASTSGVNQMFNPPLVHSVAFTGNGKSFAAGLGDATVAVVDFNSKQIVRRLRNHHAAVSQVHFPVFKRDEWLVSAGNDAQITVWDYAAAVSREGSDEEGAYVVKAFQVLDKPNAITSSQHQNLLHVADLSHVISAYPLM